MEFCPKCGMRLVLFPKETSSKFSLKCPNCNYVLKSKTSPVTTKIIDKPVTEPIVVIEEREAKIKTLPTMKMQCERCGNNEAFWWMKQTRGGDGGPGRETGAKGGGL